MPLEKIVLSCPHCWENIETQVDAQEDHFVFVEDCYICCNPIRIELWSDPEGEAEVRVSSANE